MRAAASLKRRIPDEDTRAQRARFPRRACRGLIEAHSGDVSILIIRPGFRGVHAAASLKLNSKRHRESGPALFPRRARRGLIEAVYRTTPLTEKPFVSAVCMRRPH